MDSSLLGTPACRFIIGAQHYTAQRCLVIAEIGTGHGNDRTRGRELVSAAIEAGADCVKFQHVYADEIIHRNTGLVPLPGGDSFICTIRAAVLRPGFSGGDENGRRKSRRVVPVHAFWPA